jgi:hypothetical protein
MLMRSLLRMIFSAALILGAPVNAETVDVKYQGPVSLETFDCAPIKASSLVQRLCYDQARSYLVVDLNGTYYHYCAVDPGTVEAWRSAPSLGSFYNANIKGGAFDCRVHGVPD